MIHCATDQDTTITYTRMTYNICQPPETVITGTVESFVRGGGVFVGYQTDIGLLGYHFVDIWFVALSILFKTFVGRNFEGNGNVYEH